MTDAVAAACITVGGMVITTIAGYVVQVRVTRMAIASEHRKIVAQIGAESHQRRIDDRANRVLGITSQLVRLIDPDHNVEFDRPRIVGLILESQLFLNRANPHERSLNGVLNEIGHAVDDNDRGSLLQLSSNLVETTQALITQYQQDLYPS